MADETSVILVTGASGFIGAHVVNELLKKGIKTKAMLRDLSLKSIFEENENLEIVYGDLFDIDSLKKAVSGCESVIHLSLIHI